MAGSISRFRQLLQRGRDAMRMEIVAKNKERTTRLDSPFSVQKKLCDPFLSTFTEVETSQVTPSQLPYGTRDGPLSAATFLS